MPAGTPWPSIAGMVQRGFTAAKNPRWTIPAMDGQGVPAGIDLAHADARGHALAVHRRDGPARILRGGDLAHGARERERVARAARADEAHHRGRRGHGE